MRFKLYGVIRREMIKRILIALLFVFLIFPGVDAASVWKISSGSNTIYIGGAIHLLRASDFPLPGEFDEAYQDSDILVFESDGEKMQSPEITQYILSRSVLNGTTLEQILSPAIYKRLSDYCTEIGVPIANINGLKPSMAMLALVLTVYQRMGIDQEGVDMAYFQKGREDGKEIRQFETVKEQIEFLISIGRGYEDEFVLRTIEDMKNSEKIFLDGLAAWKKGDRKAMQGPFIDIMKNDYPRMYKKLLKDRNAKWMPKIKSLIRSGKKVFILVGAAHLIGEDGILTQLEELGYGVEKL